MRSAEDEHVREAPAAHLDEDQQAKLASLGYFATTLRKRPGPEPVASIQGQDRDQQHLHRVELLGQGLHYQGSHCNA